MARNDVPVLTQETTAAIGLFAGNLHVLACLSMSWKDMVCRLKGNLIERFSAFDCDHSFVPTQLCVDNMNSCLARLWTYEHHCKRKTCWFEAQLRGHVVEHEFYCEVYSLKEQPKLTELWGAMASSFRKLEDRIEAAKEAGETFDRLSIAVKFLSNLTAAANRCSHKGCPEIMRQMFMQLPPVPAARFGGNNSSEHWWLPPVPAARFHGAASFGSRR